MSRLLTQPIQATFNENREQRGSRRLAARTRHDHRKRRPPTRPAGCFRFHDPNPSSALVQTAGPGAATRNFSRLNPALDFAPGLLLVYPNGMSADLPTRPSLLLRLRAAEDHGAWSEFVSIYTPLIFGFGRSRGLSEADAADVTQDVLKAVASSMSRFEYDPARSTFRNWLFTVVRSKFNNHLAVQARRPAPAGETTLRQFAEVTPDSAAEDAWRREYQSHLVRWAADQIRSEFKDATWNAFWRTAILGEDADAVARELGVSVNALYIARSRVTGRLKQKIDELGDPLELAEAIRHG
jgi:RNA polymerase sigma factor (sigma-70 family)